MSRISVAGILMVLLVIATNGFAANITGVTIESVSSEYTLSPWDLRAVHIVDGSGLASGGHAVTDPSGNSWQTITQSGTGNIIFDLGEVYTLDRLHIWNLNFYDPYNGRGASIVAISTSLDNSNWNYNIGNVQFQKASGFSNDPGFDLNASSWGNARYVQFNILTNWGGSDNAGHVGLSEVQFFSKDIQNNPVPVPSALFLLASGILALAGASRKRINAVI